MNRHLVPEKSSLFRNKLKKLLEDISRERENNNLQTQEAYVLEAVNLLSSFYNTVTTVNYKPEKILPGTYPSYKAYNRNFNLIKDDLFILFEELENLEGVVLEHFNLAVVRANRLNSRVKRLSSKIADYALYSKLPVKNSLFFSDTFSDLSKVEVNSDLLNATQCEINQVEGIVTLPVIQDRSEVISVPNRPLINSNSNGRAGNNEELGASLNSNIEFILDDNPDTWFEYERVVQTDDNIPLVLDFTLNLGEEQILNYIRINPNNFGTKTEIEVVDISTSTDGKIYVSVKDDIPIQGFFTKDVENVFKLAPATSKFAGQGIYTFTPRFAKYVRIVLRQSTPYFINTVQGQQFRYAIGIRDIELKRLAYESTGELVSSVFQVEDEIKKISLQSNQIPLQASELAEIEHQISVDGGNTWHSIDPIADDGLTNRLDEVPEVLNINTEDSDSIKTENPVRSIRYKAILRRHDDNFNESSTSFAQDIVTTTELKPVPLSDPWTLVLTNPPLVGSVGLIDPNFGSRGNTDSKYLVALAGSTLEYILPWKELPQDIIKTTADNLYKTETRDILSAYVDGQEWTRVDDLSNSGSEDKHFEWAPPYLRFGDGTNGKRPPSGSKIEVLFTPERLFPLDENRHISNIDFPTSVDKTTATVFRYGRILPNTISLGKKTNIHRLPHRNIQRGSLRFSDSTIFQSEKTFKNGQVSDRGGELVTNGDYSVDYERGIIYSFDQTGESSSTVSYKYQEVVELADEQWDWADDLPLHRSIEIHSDAWVDERVTGVPIPSGVRVLDLPHLSIVKGSIEFIVPNGIDDSVNPVLEEVEFTGLDSNPELTTVLKTEEPIPTLVPTGNLAEFSVSTFMSNDANLAVTFTNTNVFAEEVQTSVPASAGQYYVDRFNNKVIVHTNGTTITDPGDIHYFTNDPSRVARGSYSVDYKRGRVFFQRPIPSEGFGINYRYSDYRIYYNVAREIPEKEGNRINWKLDAASKTITLQVPEITKRANVPQASGSAAGTIKPLTYLVNYKYIATVRKNISELRDYFSPVLKDYALRIVTKRGL